MVVYRSDHNDKGDLRCILLLVEPGADSLNVDLAVCGQSVTASIGVLAAERTAQHGGFLWGTAVLVVVTKNQ